MSDILGDKRLKCFLCNVRKKLAEMEEHVEECKMDWDMKQQKVGERQLRPKEPDWFKE